MSDENVKAWKASPDEEALARALCASERVDPDGRPGGVIKVIVDGRLSDTGQDRRVTEERRAAGFPNWTTRLSQARALIALGVRAGDGR